jgi:hypothetical protein
LHGAPIVLRALVSEPESHLIWGCAGVVGVGGRVAASVWVWVTTARGEEGEPVTRGASEKGATAGVDCGVWYVNARAYVLACS